MRRRYITGLLLAGIVACEPPLHSISVVNRTQHLADWVAVTVEAGKTSLGGIAPGLTRSFTYNGQPPQKVIIEWEGPEGPCRAEVDLQGVLKSDSLGYRLKLEGCGKVTVEAEPAVPGIDPR